MWKKTNWDIFIVILFITFLLLIFIHFYLFSYVYIIIYLPTWLVRWLLLPFFVMHFYAIILYEKIFCLYATNDKQLMAYHKLYSIFMFN